MTRLHFIIRGRVQGIGYRWFVRESAEGLGLVGWVKNRVDGSVETEAEGEEKALKRFAQALRNGHPYARVDSVETRTLAAQDRNEEAFDIR